MDKADGEPQTSRRGFFGKAGYCLASGVAAGSAGYLEGTTGRVREIRVSLRGNRIESLGLTFRSGRSLKLAPRFDGLVPDDGDGITYTLDIDTLLGDVSPTGAPDGYATGDNKRKI